MLLLSMQEDGKQYYKNERQTAAKDVWMVCKTIRPQDPFAINRDDACSQNKRVKSMLAQGSYSKRRLQNKLCNSHRSLYARLEHNGHNHPLYGLDLIDDIKIKQEQDNEPYSVIAGNYRIHTSQDRYPCSYCNPRQQKPD